MRRLALASVALLTACGSVEYGALEYGDVGTTEYVAAPPPVYGASPAPAEGRVEISVFLQELAPYGQWLQHPQYGQVFLPHDPDYRPYRNGHWAESGEDLVWVSYDAIGWAVCHYGSWAVLEDGRWAWIPDTEWSPAWVEWRETDQYVGWAPRMVGYYPDPTPYWIFVESTYLLYDSVAYYAVEPTYAPTVYATGRPMNARPGRRWLHDRGVRRAVAGTAGVRPHRGPPGAGVRSAEGGRVVVRDGIPEARGGTVIARGPARAPLVEAPPPRETVVLDRRGRGAYRVDGPVTSAPPPVVRAPEPVWAGPRGPRVVRPVPTQPMRVERAPQYDPAPRVERAPQYDPAPRVVTPRYDSTPRVVTPRYEPAPRYEAPVQQAPRYEAPAPRVQRSDPPPRRADPPRAAAPERRVAPRGAPVGGFGVVRPR